MIPFFWNSGDPSSPAQTGLCPGEKEVGDHVSEGGPRETEQLYTEHIPS